MSKLPCKMRDISLCTNVNDSGQRNTIGLKRALFTTLSFSLRTYYHETMKAEQYLSQSPKKHQN